MSILEKNSLPMNSMNEIKNDGVIPTNVRNGRVDITNLGNQSGFTLLELLVAIVLLSIGVFAVLGMQSTALHANSHAHQLSVATSMAQQVLEDIMSWDALDSRINVADGGPYDYYPDSAHPANNYITVPGAGKYITTFTKTTGTSANGIPTGSTRVVVRVTFENNNTVTIIGFKRMV